MQKTFKIKDGKIDRTRFFKANEKFHRDMAKIPFEQKIENLGKMRKIVDATRKFRLRNMRKDGVKPSPF